jgi:hypothetical protein
LRSGNTLPRPSQDVVSRVCDSSRPVALAGDVAALLRALIEKIDTLTALVEHRRPASTLSRIDRERLARMLPAIGGVYGSDPFLVRELFESDKAAIRLVRTGLNAKKIGRLFRRAERQAIGGYLVESQGTETHATLWRVLEVPEFPPVRNLLVSPRRDAGLVYSGS